MALRPTIAASKVCYIAIKAREFDAQEDVVEPDYGSDAADDRFVQILEAYADDPTLDELNAAIDSLDEDEQCELVALAWIGRGDHDAEGWEEALQLAHDGHTPNTALYLAGMPLLSDYLEEGLAAFDLSCEETAAQHL